MIRALLVGFVVLLAQPVLASELIVQVTDGAGKRGCRRGHRPGAPGGCADCHPGAGAAPGRGTRATKPSSPLVTIVPRGGEVEFHNSDRTRHHVYSFSPARAFEFVLAPGEVSEAVRLDRTGVVAVGCNTSTTRWCRTSTSPSKPRDGPVGWRGARAAPRPPRRRLCSPGMASPVEAGAARTVADRHRHAGRQQRDGDAQPAGQAARLVRPRAAAVLTMAER